MFLRNSVSGGRDFMILSMEFEGDDWSLKSDTESPFPCLDDDIHSLDLTMNDDH